MPNLNIIITPAADADMQDIFDFIAQNNFYISMGTYFPLRYP